MTHWDPVLSAVCDVMFKGTVCRHCHKSADLTVCDKWGDRHKACSGKIDRLMDRQPVLVLCTLCSFKTLNASFCKANYLLHSDDTVYVQIALRDRDWPNHKSLLKNHTLGVLMKKCLVTCVKNICQILLIDFDGFSAVRPWRKKVLIEWVCNPTNTSSVFIITFDTNDPFPQNTWYFVLLLAAHCLLKNLIPKLKCIHQTAVVALTPILEMPLWLYCSQRCLFTQNRVGGL